MTTRAMTAETAGPMEADRPRVLPALLPIMGVVFVAFLVIGGAMPVLPLHVHDDLGFGPFIVGLVTGSQFAAALVARIWAGRTSDAHGAKRAVVAGLVAAAAAGLVYLLSLAFTAYAAALIAARVFLGHLPDRLGGAKVALPLVAVEAVGLALMGMAPTVSVAAAGAALTGLGYALVSPGFGVEAVRRSPPGSRGVAMGAYTACLDLALGISGPGLGLVAGHAGLGAVFLVSALVVLCAVAAGLPLLKKGPAR